VWNGDLPPLEALVLTNELLEEPFSRYRAERLGGRQFLGWGEDRRLAAATHDWIRFLIPAAVGAKVPPEAAWPRPKTETAQPVNPVGTIAGFDAPAFLAGKWD
jgi:hypothetical protein